MELLQKLMLVKKLRLNKRFKGLHINIKEFFSMSSSRTIDPLGAVTLMQFSDKPQPEVSGFQC